MTRRIQFGSALLAGLTCLICSAAREARADDPRLAVDLFQSARQLMNEGKYDKACPMLTDSQKADPQPGTQLNLAVCYEKIDKTASAWSVYSDLMQTGGPLQKQTASAAIERLQPKLSRLKIDVCERPNFDPAQLVVTRNGEELGRSVLGRPSPVDAGTYQIEAHVGGFDKWSRSVVVAPESDLQRVEICALTPAAPASVPTTSSPKPALLSASTAPEPPARTQPSRSAAYVSGGVTIAAALFGGTLTIVAVNQKSDAKSECPDKRCSAGGWNRLASAKKSADLATVGFAVAGAAGVATLYFALRKPTVEQERSLVKAPRMGLTTDKDGWSLALSGAF